MLQRSYNVGEFPGHFVFPGGHPELKQRRSSNFESVYVWKNQQLSKRSTEIVQIAEVGSSITDVLDCNKQTGN